MKFEEAIEKARFLKHFWFYSLEDEYKNIEFTNDQIINGSYILEKISDEKYKYWYGPQPAIEEKSIQLLLEFNNLFPIDHVELGLDGGFDIIYSYNIMIRIRHGLFEFYDLTEPVKSNYQPLKFKNISALFRKISGLKLKG